MFPNDDMKLMTSISNESLRIHNTTEHGFVPNADYDYNRIPDKIGSHTDSNNGTVNEIEDETRRLGRRESRNIKT